MVLTLIRLLVTRGLEGALRIQSTSRSLFLTAALCLVASASSVAQTETTYLISGRVHDESNQGVAEIRVCAVPEDYDQVRKAPCGLSDAGGNFVIRTGRPALYRLFPEKSAAGYFVQFSPFFRHPSFPITEVVLNESNKTTSASVSVSLSPKNGALVGKSVDAGTGRPIDNTWFLLCQAANPKICWRTSAKNPAGKFHLPAAYVPFTLRAYANGYEDWFGLNGFDKNQPITLASGTSLEVVFYLKRRPQTVNRALDESEKQPFANLPAPVQLGPADQVELNHYPRLTKLEWQPVEGAVSYSVEVDFCDGRNKKLRECINPQPHSFKKDSPPSGIVGTSYEFAFVGSQPGRWRVWAIDNKGQEGFKSPWRTFFYIR